nr:hypothetical protein [Prevotella sp.]
IKDANFNRNDQRKSAWTMEAENQNLSGGNNENNCAESYHSVFSLSQVVEGLPNGVYEMTAQGFYRQDGTDADNLPYFFINDLKTTFPLRTGEENSMTSASESFTQGLYTILPMKLMVSDGKITVGAKNEANLELWCIWDNFQLKYYGENADVNLLDQEIAVERYTGKGYGADQAEVDFANAKQWLGVEELTTDMLRIENPDGELISDYAPFDGWFNGDGVAETWGDNTKICVKFFQAIPEGKFEICDMNGADEVGKTYNVKWRLVNGEKSVRYNIGVTFVEAPEYKPEIISTIDVPVTMAPAVAYEGLTATFPLDELVAALGVNAITEAKQYIVNVTKGNFVENTTDGWRDANGDAASWGSGEGMVCVKINDPASGTIDYLGAIDDTHKEGDTYTAKWGFVNAEDKAVVLNINITFSAIPEGWISIVNNGSLEGDDVSNYFSKEAPSTETLPSTIIEGAGMNGSRGIVVKSADNPTQTWDSQFFIKLNETLPEGTKLHVEFDYMADKAAKTSTQSHGEPGAYKHWQMVGDVNFTTEWQHFSTEVDITGSMADMQTIAFNLSEEATATEYHFDNFVIWMQKPAPVDEWVDILVNGNMEGNEVENFYKSEQGIGGPMLATITDGIGIDGGRAIAVQSADEPTNNWDTQFFIRLPKALPAGTKYKVEFDYKADKEGGFETQAHAEPGSYIHWDMIGNGTFTADWQHFEKQGSITAEQSPEGNMQTIAFNLALNKVATQFIFDNIKFCVEKDFYETGIFEIANEQLPTEGIYNLRGQKVDKATKGLYIINGKKVFIK